MTISPRKWEKVTAFLSTLPRGAALKLFMAIEADRNTGGIGLPHNDILDDLRRRLVDEGATLPGRRPDARRLFYTPFEDFLVSSRRTQKRKAQIARSSLAPIWQLLNSDSNMLDAAHAAARLDRLLNERMNENSGLALSAFEEDAYQSHGEGSELAQAERALFLAAEAGFSRVCDRAYEDEKVYRQYCELLGGEAAFEDFAELRRLLTGVDYFKKLHLLAPRSSAGFSEEQVYNFRSLFLSAHGQSKTLGQYLLLALRGRLAHPWQAMGVYYNLARSADERLAPARETLATLPESLFDDLEDLARALENDGSEPLDPGAARLRVNYFADYADGLAQQAAKIGDNVYMNRVEACRDVAADAFDRFAEQALAALRQATPARIAGGSSKLVAPRPDFGRGLTDEVVDDATDAAALLSGARGLAKRLGADVDVIGSIADDARKHIHQYGRDLVVEIRAAEGDERRAARLMFEDIAKISEPLLTSDEVGLLRDRAAAAAVAV